MTTAESLSISIAISLNKLIIRLYYLRFNFHPLLSHDVCIDAGYCQIKYTYCA